MLKCSKEAFVQCPYNCPCGRLEEAFFLEGSDCDRFNREVAKPPMTNADRIRAMSDEELAAYWSDHYDDFCQSKPECGEALNRGEPIPDEWCVVCAFQWLRQPANPLAAVPDTEDKQHSGLIEEE